jgi:(2Fe-2S) ferredoxin
MRVKAGKDEQQPTTLAICVNRRFNTDRPSCAGRGSKELADLLEKEIAARKLNVVVERVCCFGFCTQGPNVRLYPGGAHYYEVADDDVPAILADVERECGQRTANATEAAMRFLGS